jgi:hypothetical protein
MRPLDLKEFAEDMRRKGDIRDTDFADEILALLDIEADVAEPYSDLCFDIENYAKDFSNRDDAPKALEWLGDRSNMLAEIEKHLAEAGHEGDADDAVKAVLRDLEEAREVLTENGLREYDL